MNVRMAVAEKLARVSATGTFLIRNGSKTTMHCIEKALPKMAVLRSAGELAGDLLTLMPTDISRTFVSLAEDVYREPCSQPLHDIDFEFVMSVYIPGGLVPEL